jgi:hypothetical protein
MAALARNAVGNLHTVILLNAYPRGFKTTHRKGKAGYSNDSISISMTELVIL